MNQIIVSDRCQKLKEEVKKLQAVIAALTFERDDLIYNICPELEARYAREIGNPHIKIRRICLSEPAMWSS